MRSSRQSSLVHGVVGGLLAGASVALWFLVVDLVAGDPLSTPTALGRALFGVAENGGISGTVLLYTVLHFGTFGIVGALTATFLTAVGVSPRVGLGLFFGICVLTTIHYVGLLVTDERLLDVLPAGHVVGANLLAGVLLMTYLHRTRHEERPFGWTALAGHPLLAEGLKVGVIGALAVGVWFFVIDIVLRSPFHTPAALGSMLFLGADGTDNLSVTPAIVAAFTVLHLVAFSVIGVAFVAAARGVEQLPSIALFVVLGGILLEALTFSILVAFGGWVLGSVSTWAVGGANLLAVGAMGGWIWREHPGIRARVLEGLGATTP